MSPEGVAEQTDDVPEPTHNPLAGILKGLHPQQYPVYSNLASYLNLHDLLALRRTCRGLSHILPAVARSRWNIDRHLRKFFENTTRFRTLLRQGRGMVVGSDALEFFLAENYDHQNGTMEIFLQEDAIIIWKLGLFLQREGYKFKPLRGQQPADFTEAIQNGLSGEGGRWTPKKHYDMMLFNESRKVDALRFSRSNNGHKRSIAISYICSSQETPGIRAGKPLPPDYRPIVKEFTQCMTLSHLLVVYTWDKAYCLLPQHLLKKQSMAFAAHSLQRYRLGRGETLLSSIKKWKNTLGWQVILPFNIPKAKKYYWLYAERYLGDKATWVINLNDGSVDPKQSRKDISTALDKDDEDEQISSVRFQLLSSIPSENFFPIGSDSPLRVRQPLTPDMHVAPEFSELFQTTGTA